MNTVQEEEEIKYVPEGAKWFCIIRSQGLKKEGKKKSIQLIGSLNIQALGRCFLKRKLSLVTVDDRGE